MVLKGLVFTNFHLEGFGGLERTYFCQFSPWEDVVVLKGMVYF